MNKNQPPSVWGALGLAGTLGLVIVLPMVFGSILGNYLDGLTHTKDIYLLLGLLLGLTIGILGAYRLLKPFFKR